jgi:F-type H+/Na+-transporting ATPase subunit alpha
MNTILEELESAISGLKTQTTRSNVGVVREVGDGVCKIEGLSDVMLNEMIEFPGGTYGLALNLEETNVGAILLGDYSQIIEGTEVRTTGRILSVPVGKGLLGRVVNALGQPVDGKGLFVRRRLIRWRRLRRESLSGARLVFRYRPAFFRSMR